MDELNEDQLRDLEEQLYSQVHHQASTFSETSGVGNLNSGEVDETQTKNTKFLSNRYWAKGNNPDNANNISENQKEKNDENDVNKGLVETTTFGNQNKHIQPAQKVAPPTKKKQKNKKVRNPFVTKPIQNSKNAQLNKASLGGPFARQAQQLQRASQYENKKQKSKNARANVSKQPKVIETVVLDCSSDSDSDQEVIVVPLPPAPIYNIDDSDEDEVAKISDIKDPPHETATDAFITPKTKKTSSNIVSNEQANDTASRCNSPNSVMSQDDFIGQNDRQRLLKNATIADDSDLLILTSNSDSLLEVPTPPRNLRWEQDCSNDIECIGTFIKPTACATATHDKDQASYRVDQNGFRAMDVYESESDIVSDGVYSKGLTKSKPATTIIRNVDNSSDSEMDATTSIQAKTKRLRKRRASGSLKGSESNGGAQSSGTEEEDGVSVTAVPFIARGPAVESCKSKRFRKRTGSSCASQNESASGSRPSHMPDSEFIATLNSLAQGNNDQEASSKSTDGDSEDENLPTARDIAETVINQQQASTSTPIRRNNKRQTTEKQVQNKSNEEISFDDAVPAEIADDIEKLFDKINELAAKKAIEVSDEDDCETSVVSHIDPTSDISVAIADQTAPVDQVAHFDNNIKYFIAYTPANNERISDGFGWNEEMQRFYNYSWGGENAREEDILKHMSRDRRLWTISDADRFLTKHKRDRREKCINCYSFGHIRARCPKPRKPLMCYMCGESGHQESRCPNTRCLRCGSKTNIYSQSCKKCMYWNNRICPICKLRGHSLNDCPDKWRRYHSTTKPNVYPNSRVIYNKRRYCCFCGRRGHLSDDCKKAMFRSEYPMISTEIKSHEKSYDDVILKSSYQQEIPCRLLFDPNVTFDFGLAAKTTHNCVYGRFLTAVGLGKLIGQPKTVERPPKLPNIDIENEQPSCSNTSNAFNTSPEQVHEVSESTNETLSKNSESLQMPPPRSRGQPTHDIKNEPLDHDSDSNYSFSDHFEFPTSSTQQCAKTDPLPDFISINNSAPSKVYETQDDDSTTELVPKLGISARYAESYSDDDDIAMPAVPTKDDVACDIECEAKIYVSNEHSSYFQSKLGQEYLSKVMLDNNLRGRLNKTIVGYALFIYGLPVNQEKLQQELELKYKSLNDKKTLRYESSKVPKQVDVLTRFLRDSINQLYSNLGNASDLYKRLVALEKYTSKNSTKSADRVRRTLNMIFLGQAGLFNGDKHIETLLNGLNTLVNDFKGSDKTPEDLRNTIDSSWRMLFTPYHHKNYSQLLLAYLKAPPGSRNRMPQLKVDPVLLGRSQLNVFVSDEQRIRFNEYSEQCEANTNTNTNTTTKAIEEGTLLLNVVATEKDHQQSENNPSVAHDNVENQANLPTLEKNQQSQQDLKSTVCVKPVEKKTINPNDKDCQPTLQKKQLSQQNSKSAVWDKSVEKKTENSNSKAYEEVLSGIALSPNPYEKECSAVLKDSKTPSMFWSRESQKYLLEMIKSATEKSSNLDRLERIYKKAITGGLSYNDYRSVIELYNITKKISKKC